MWDTLYLGALVGVGVSLLALAAYAAQYQSAPGVTWFVGSLVANSVWTLLAVAGLLSGNHLQPIATLVPGGAEAARFWLELVMGAAGVLSIGTWVLFVIHYTGRTDLFTQPVRTGILYLVGLLILAIMTTPAHELIYRDDYSTSTVRGLSVLDPTVGPLFGFVVAIGVGVIGLSIWLLVGLLWTNDRLFSRQTLLMLVGVVAPFLLAGVHWAGDQWVQDLQNLPVVPLGFAITSVCFAYAMFVEDLLSLTPATSYVGTRDAIRNLDDGLVMVSGGGKVLKTNDSALEFLGMEDATGQPVEEVFEPLGVTLEDLPTDISYQGQFLALSTSEITDENDRPIGQTITIRDVTDRRTRKQRLQVLNRIMRHNLRNDIGVVKGYAETMTDTDGDEREVSLDSMAERIERKTDDLVSLSEKARITEQLFATPQRREEVSIPDRIDALLTRLEREYPRVPVETDVPDECTIVTEMMALDEVLYALAENATDYANPQSPTVQITARETETGAEIVIDDNGPGIPQPEIDILESGNETALEHGSGLGLWLANWGTKQLEGNLSFDVDDDGTRVAVSVPCLQQRHGIDPAASGAQFSTAESDD
jgi:signal transduction histidine kinase